MKSKNQRFCGTENEQHFLKKIFDVKGMHCNSCEILIKDSLSEVDGVKHVKVSHAKGTLTVKFDEAKVSEDQIMSIIRKEGYEVLK
jgi:copper chaperone